MEKLKWMLCVTSNESELLIPGSLDLSPSCCFESFFLTLYRMAAAKIQGWSYLPL